MTTESAEKYLVTAKSGGSVVRQNVLSAETEHEAFCKFVKLYDSNPLIMICKITATKLSDKQ